MPPTINAVLVPVLPTLRLRGAAALRRVARLRLRFGAAPITITRALATFFLRGAFLLVTFLRLTAPTADTFRLATFLFAGFRLAGLRFALSLPALYSLPACFCRLLYFAPGCFFFRAFTLAVIFFSAVPAAIFYN